MHPIFIKTGQWLCLLTVLRSAYREGQQAAADNSQTFENNPYSAHALLRCMCWREGYSTRKWQLIQDHLNKGDKA